eukprot:NODE_1400_length_1551_cov_37.673103_g1261_i0.p1 GENE.NODE_1400_length_1551_cov_37.673103_g1261_i0~~NODE_1400_length_1551_cov_37.673103_g1261_i0.p1  ORF type:complete len:449 (+),score=74.09 NODE_1400_length_1551_cov_37.673103_g1261_i0:138-1484(+)
MSWTVDASRVHEFDETGSAGFEHKLDTLTQWMRESQYTVLFTGAGISTASGIGDYRGPTGAWTKRRIRKLNQQQVSTGLTIAETRELALLQREANIKAATAPPKALSKMDAQPSLTHMAQATLVRHSLAHFIVTMNLDGLYRKAGMIDHTQVCYLHGDMYIERCTSCGYDFERNYHVRPRSRHINDHKIGVCSKCGSKPPSNYRGTPGTRKMVDGCWGGVMVGTKDSDCGTKDTQINFGELLDERDWNDAEEHCGKADLCIVAGTSMSLGHVTHFPFMAKRVAIINLQPTKSDERADLRVWAPCDLVFAGLMRRLELEIDPIPVWQPRDGVTLADLPEELEDEYKAAAARLQERTFLALGAPSLSTVVDANFKTMRATRHSSLEPGTLDGLPPAKRLQTGDEQQTLSRWATPAGDSIIQPVESTCPSPILGPPSPLLWWCWWWLLAGR